MPRELENHTPDEARCYTTLLHELGHYVFGFYDEYGHDGYVDLSKEVYENSLMVSNHYWFSYNDQYNGVDPNTEQMDERGMSCWECFVEEFNTEGNDDQKINLQADVEQDDYRPWEMYDGENVLMKVNYDFSCDSLLNPGDDYKTKKTQ